MSNKYSEREVERLRDSIPAQTQAAERAGLYLIAELLRTANNQLAAAREIVRGQTAALKGCLDYFHDDASVPIGRVLDDAAEALRLTEESSDE